jgi:hypothetical protein
MQEKKVVLGSQLKEKFEESSLEQRDFVELLISSFYISLQITIIIKLFAVLFTLI